MQGVGEVVVVGRDVRHSGSGRRGERGAEHRDRAGEQRLVAGALVFPEKVESLARQWLWPLLTSRLRHGSLWRIATRAGAS
jgi:hypothetical protein